MENNLEAIKGAVLVSGVATFLSLGILKYQEFQQVTQPEATRVAVLVSGVATFLSLGILKYQDQILEFSCQVTQPIKDAMGESFGKILDFLADVKEKVMSLPSAFSSTAQCTADGQDIEVSTPEISTRSIADRIKDLVPNIGQN